LNILAFVFNCFIDWIPDQKTSGMTGIEAVDFRSWKTGLVVCLSLLFLAPIYFPLLLSMLAKTPPLIFVNLAVGAKV
jgi:hypothetical protein